MRCVHEDLQLHEADVWVADPADKRAQALFSSWVSENKRVLPQFGSRTSVGLLDAQYALVFHNFAGNTNVKYNITREPYSVLFREAYSYFSLRIHIFHSNTVAKVFLIDIFCSLRVMGTE